MNVPDEAVKAALPWITSFLARRGMTLRGQEGEVLARYVLRAGAPYLDAQG
jgi:hypothetical protein